MSLSINRPLPNNIDAECALLGTLLIDDGSSTSQVGEVLSVVKPEWFYKRMHQEIFAAIGGTFKKGEPEYAGRFGSI